MLTAAMPVGLNQPKCGEEDTASARLAQESFASTSPSLTLHFLVVEFEHLGDLFLGHSVFATS